jgi:hypothetical protein
MEEYTKDKDVSFGSITWEAQNYDAVERRFQEVCTFKISFFNNINFPFVTQEKTLYYLNSVANRLSCAGVGDA